MSKVISIKNDANSYGLGQMYIPTNTYAPSYGQVLIANTQSSGGLVIIQQSKGKKILNISGGNKKIFIFEEQNQSQNVVTALHPEDQDYLEYKGQDVFPIQNIVMELQGNKINQIKSGKQHNVILTDQGYLFSFGKGNFGSLGLGGTVFAANPKLINKLNNKRIVSIACGMYHTLALSDIGDVYSWGRGFEGQLGLLENIQCSSIPQCIPHFFKYNHHKDVKMLQKVPIIAIACGSYHSIALNTSYEIYCWGQARYGQTGTGKKTKEPIPQKIDIVKAGVKQKVQKISGGFGHTLCLTSEGDIYSWGLNIKGQLGLNDLPENIKSTEQHLNYIKYSSKPLQITEARDKSKLPKFKEIACGFTSSFALDLSGNFWAWGGGNLGFKDKFIERGPVMITETTYNKKFSKIFANNDSVVLFCPLNPLFFKPSLVPSNGNTQLTFFGNGFVNTGAQSARFTLDDDKVEVNLQFDQKTNTYYCKTPVFQKINKKFTYPMICKIQISLDKKDYILYEKQLLIYSSKLQIESIQPNCGSVLGGSIVKLYMPLPNIILSYIQNITVGFKNNSIQKKDSVNKLQNNSDWLCSQGVYENQVITCKIPNIPHFDHQNPFYMLDVSLNGQQFTDLPHTFRYYFITEPKVTPNEGTDDAQSQCIVSGNGLFDTPHKQLKVSLNFTYNEQKIVCLRPIELKWNKSQKSFSFKMPKLSWIIGDHILTPELLQAARKQACIFQLFLTKTQSIQIGKYTFTIPPPPPEPEEDKKDNKKDNKKAAKK